MTTKAGTEALIASATRIITLANEEHKNKAKRHDLVVEAAAIITLAKGIPSLTLLCKLGSIVVHADEMTDPGAHEYDRTAMMTLIADPEVQAWIKGMGALLPLKRSARC